MSQIPWNQSLAVFLGTLPLMGIFVWNLVKIDRIEKRLDDFATATNSKLDTIGSELTGIRERLATLEERDRWTHGVVKP